MTCTMRMGPSPAAGRTPRAPLAGSTCRALLARELPPSSVLLLHPVSSARGHHARKV
eukprot:CAMPEP_0179289866 /NCGR_PEP_ID=MMETSP0797-20121207/41525_1 /TAXON_ID=47934 /ORGANISM="Dinophysis acuminata, Strain DAEP01" /LENGTH=56 /DNA_ID=CAMNT_0020998889 /DNA_START=87 /DNA_END=257 /DNA_ORIENTATION=+